MPMNNPLFNHWLRKKTPVEKPQALDQEPLSRPHAGLTVERSVADEPEPLAESAVLADLPIANHWVH